MAMVINSNVLSMNAQRQLMQSRADLDQTMERLSSGQRINSAADDAAGLSISSKMTSQVRGLNQAIRNANDGISMLQTAEGAMVESTNILQRMRELSIQSANGIYSDSDRVSLNAEYAQLVSEIDRIASTTSFNGLTLLNGATSDISLQVGAQASETIGLGLERLDSYSLGLFSTSSLLIGDQLNVDSSNGLLAVDYDRTFRIDTDLEKSETNNVINDVFQGDSVRTLVDAINQSVIGVEAGTLLELVASGEGTGDLTNGNTLTIKTFDIDGQQRDLVIGDTTTMQQIANKINDQSEGYLLATVNSDGVLKITSEDAATILVKDSTGGLASGITNNSITDEDAEKIIFAIKNYWVSEAEQLIEENYGLKGNSENIEVRIVEDNQGGVLAYVTSSYKLPSGEAFDLSLTVDLADYQDITLPDGDNGGIFSLDRVIAHEMVHAVFGVNLGTTNLTAPSWFTEGFPELIHGADDRVSAELSGLIAANGTGSEAAALAAYQSVFDLVTTSGSPTAAGTYSVAYVTAKLLTDAILANGSNLTAFFSTVAASGLDQAINDHTSIANSVSTFETYARANGYDYLTGDFLGFISRLDLSDNDTGSIAGYDYNATPELNSVALDANSDGDIDKFEILPNDPDAGPGTDFRYTYTDEYRGDYRTVDTRLVLRSLDNSDFAVVSLKEEDKGGAADLANLGFLTNRSYISGGRIDYIADVDGAQEAIGQIDAALSEVSSRRGELGAAMNRLEFSINNLANVSENAAAARSRILDADYAAETTTLWRNNVLQNAGIAMLAQANSMPNQVLTLLRT